MRKFIILFILLCSVRVQAADPNLLDMTELTDVAGGDMFYVVDDPSGTPLDKKITGTNIFDLINTSAKLFAITGDETGSGGGTPLLMFNYNPTITLGPILTGADHNPAVAGEIRYDNTIAGLSGGGIRWYDNNSVRLFVDLETDPVDGDDDYVVAWDKDADGWYMKAESGGSIDDSVYGAGWDGDTTTAASRNAIYDKIQTLGGGGEDLAATLGFGADGADIDQTSLGKLEFFDAGLFLDADADGVMNLSSDGTLELHSADWDIGTTGIATGMGNFTSDGTIEGATLTEGGNAVWNASETDILDSAHYIAASIDNEHLADDAVDSAELATDAVGVDALDQTISPTLTGRWTFAGEDAATDVIGLNVNWAGSDPVNGQLAGDLWYDSTLNLYKGYTTHEIILGSAEQPGIIQAKKGSGGTIAAGDAVYITGFDGTDLLVELADADDSSKMPAIGIASGTINSGTAGAVTTFGLLEDIINTSAMAVGDGIWITATGTTGNTLTNTKPTGATTALQRIATVASVAASGELFVAGALRTNDLPNLTEAYIFVGNGSNYATAVAMGGDVAIIADGTTAIQIDTIGTAEMANADHGDVAWSGGAAEVQAQTVASAGAGTYYIGFFGTDSGANLSIETDGALSFAQASGTLASTEFSGGGGSLTAVDAATGDSATSFFDTGTIEHEWGGLQADISGYTGLIGITGADTTVEVDLLSELLTAIGDVTAFITDDDMPAVGTNPTVNAAGEIGRDTDDHNLRGYDGASEFVYAQRYKSKGFMLAFPDTLQSAQDVWLFWKVTAEEYPFGVTIRDIWMTASSSNSASYTFEEWSDANPPVHVADIETVAFSASTQAEDDGTMSDGAVAADTNVGIDLDTTDLDWVQITVGFTVNVGN